VRLGSGGLLIFNVGIGLRNFMSCAGALLAYLTSQKMLCSRRKSVLISLGHLDFFAPRFSGKTKGAAAKNSA